jgi:hypothetical protein
VGLALWWNAWSGGASTHTLCGCGDPALFLWFFQWPATAVAHLHNPFFSTALFHPNGINLLAQTSVMGLSVPLIPVTWIWGPVAALNVASTLVPALSALSMFYVLRRWVRWSPAAFIGGLLYGFSPAVLTSLQYAHLMTGAIMLLPLIVGVLDDILLRQRHNPLKTGLLLGVLVFAQFFLSSELLAIMALLVAFAVVVLLVAGYVGDRDRLHELAPHAAGGLIVGTVVGGALLALPVSFALLGPGHLSGTLWPNIGVNGGYNGSSFVGPAYLRSRDFYAQIGGYEGRSLPSSGYLGWALISVLIAGTVAWFRDRRLWFFGLMVGVCVYASLAERPGDFVPANVLGHLPLVNNIIPQRFMTFGFMAVAVVLALIVDHARRDVPRILRLRGAEGRVMGVGAALGVTAIGLVPMVTLFGPTLPFTMAPVVLPSWYATAAPKLPPDRVVLSYPAPWSGIQVSMAWQAVDAMSYSQAGGGGPQGTVDRAGAARAGFSALTRLAFGVGFPQPLPTAANLKAVRQAISVWQVTTVVIAPQPGAPVVMQGHNPIYAAAYMTAALGRPPTLEAGAWVWNNAASGIKAGATPALRLTTKSFDLCVLFFSQSAGARATPGIGNCVTNAGGLP